MGGYLMGWVDKPLEEVGDAEASSQVLNFVESDGLSRVRVRHVGFTLFIPNCPNELEVADVAGLKQMEEVQVWIFAFSRWNIHKKGGIGRFGCTLGSRFSDAFSSLDSDTILLLDISCAPFSRFARPSTQWVTGLPLAGDTFEP